MTTPSTLPERRVPPGAVVVGVDGSTSSRLAVTWAAHEAARRGVELVIVHAWLFPLYHLPLDAPLVGLPEAGLEAAARRVLDDATRYARQAEPAASVTTLLVAGSPSATLMSAAVGAGLVVTGGRGLGGFTGLLVGSVGVQLAAHAPCPVVVVRPGPHGGDEVDEDGPLAEPGIDGPVMVGVDDSQPSRAAVRFAADFAARAGAPLVALHHYPPGVVTQADDEVRRKEATDSVRQVLSDAMGDAGADVEVRLVPAWSTGALIDTAAEARLLVLGSRGRGGFTGLLLGSTSQYALHHAVCPVAVVGDHRS